MDRLAEDVSNVENIDLAELQRRHRLLAAAYRSDRRKLDEATAQLAQLSAALGTQERLQSAYTELKEAHQQQSIKLQSLQDEVKKGAKYKQTAKQQELIIQKLEKLMTVAMKDAKRAKELEAKLASTRDELTQAHEATATLKKEQREAPLAAGEEQVKLKLRAERAERRAAAMEEEMTEMARANARELAGLKLKIAEKEAQLLGGFGSSANLPLHEINSPAAHRSHPRPGSRPGSGAKLDPLGYGSDASWK